MNLGKLLEDEGQLGVQVVEGIGLALFNYKPILFLCGNFVAAYVHRNYFACGFIKLDLCGL